MTSPFNVYGGVVLVSIYREQVNSKGAILEATVDYIRSLRVSQQRMAELETQVDKLEAQQRKLLLQREVRYWFTG